MSTLAFLNSKTGDSLLGFHHALMGWRFKQITLYKRRASASKF